MLVHLLRVRVSIYLISLKFRDYIVTISGVVPTLIAHPDSQRDRPRTNENVNVRSFSPSRSRVRLFSDRCQYFWPWQRISRARREKTTIFTIQQLYSSSKCLLQFQFRQCRPYCIGNRSRMRKMRVLINFLFSREGPARLLGEISRRESGWNIKTPLDSQRDVTRDFTREARKRPNAAMVSLRVWPWSIAQRLHYSLLCALAYYNFINIKINKNKIPQSRYMHMNTIYA